MRIDLPRTVLAAAILAAAAAAAQNVPESVEVKRPDGTVIQPRPPDPPDARDTSQAQRATRAEDLVERSRAEREGAMQNPARQRDPTTGR
jgi:hypothetical protein